MQTTAQLFSDVARWTPFHDALLAVDSKPRTREELIALFESLPHNLRQLAREWGLADTEFRESVIRHLRGAAR